MISMIKRVEQALTDRFDQIEYLKESLVEAEETIRSQLESYVEHKMCKQKVYLFHKDYPSNFSSFSH